MNTVTAAMNATHSKETPIGGCLERLVRRLPLMQTVRWEIVGLSCKCGGRILIRDWKGHASRDWRWEAYCESCGSCDPNGYANLKATCQGAAKYFSPNDRTERPEAV